MPKLYNRIVPVSDLFALISLWRCFEKINPELLPCLYLDNDTIAMAV